MHVERELQDLRERLAQVEQWKARHDEIEEELGRVWVEGGGEVAPPAYVEKEGEKEEKKNAGDEGKGVEGEEDEGEKVEVEVGEA